MTGFRLCLILTILVGLKSAALAAKVSGPTANEPVPALNVYFAVPDETGEICDVVDRRGDKPTIYFVVPSERWSRPTARLLKTLDTKINAIHSEAKIVAVWLSDDIEAAREYLPRVQASIKLKDTFWTVNDGKASGPESWKIDLDAEATIVVVNVGQVISSKGYDSENETLADNLLAELKRSLPKP